MKLSVGLTTLICIFLIPLHVCAHKIMAYWEVEETVHLSFYFPDRSPVKGASVVVKGVGGEVVAEGVTDKEGRFTFRAKGAPLYTAICEGGVGHRTEVTIPLGARKGGEKEGRMPLRELFSGLGYIIGLAGILMWAFSRRKTTRR